MMVTIPYILYPTNFTLNETRVFSIDMILGVCDYAENKSFLSNYFSHGNIELHERMCFGFFVAHSRSFGNDLVIKWASIAIIAWWECLAVNWLA